MEKAEQHVQSAYIRNADMNELSAVSGLKERSKGVE